MGQNFDIPEELKKLPKQPGVYIMRDANDTIIYVGKAVSLRSRVRQYFQSTKNKTPKVIQMVSHVDHFEYIVTDSELEALVLEANLIKENRPKYNTMLKDDKSYPYIKVTMQEMYPRILMVRGMKRDGAKYYGPFPTAGAVHDTIELLRKVGHIRTCSMKLPENQGRERPCLYYYIGQCPGPCIPDKVRPEDYRKNADHVISFLNGHVDQEIDALTEKMNAAAEKMEYEQAAEYRDLIESIRIITERQKITSEDGADRDVIAVAADTAKEENASLNHIEAVAQVFMVRGGKLVGREHFFLTTEDAADKPQILQDFISQYYAGTPFIPKEIMTETALPDGALVEKMLSDRRGGKVRLLVPQRGLKEKLVEMARENAETALTRDRERLQREEMRTAGAVHEIETLLGIPKADRMEAYDISNISGVESVGSMVVYEKGRPKRSDYRKFRIKTVEGPNDYASMREVLTRRFKRAAENSAGFTRLPDLLLMDGGQGQVHIAEEVLRDTGFDFIPVAGMVKDDYHRTRAIWFHGSERPIDRHSEGFKLVTRIQDEAHRFAIEYHRQLRSKGQVRSVLDDIPGIGATRRRALLMNFGSIEEIRSASVDKLMEVPAMNKQAAESVWAFFHKEH